MTVEFILSQLDSGKIFGRRHLQEIIHKIDPTYSNISITRLLDKLRRENQVVRIGYGKYIKVDENDKKQIYRYNHSKEYLQVESLIVQEYPLINFQMWELIQWNEFIDHPFTKNAIVVEVENMFEDVVFEILHKALPNVIYKPSVKNLRLHKVEDNTVLVFHLFSEVIRAAEHHSCVLEKMLTDLLPQKFMGNIIERSEYKKIFEVAFDRYYLDSPKMFRYAKRREVGEKFQYFIEEDTNITLPKSY